MWASAVQALVLVGLAELGDKSQLLCLTLAARWRPLPVWAGATLAFAVLNTLAVTVGALLASWIPDRALAVGSGLLFVAFGLRALWTAGADDDAGDEASSSARSPLLATFGLIVVAEMGDKTQLAVAGLATSGDPVGTWLGATVALAGTSALGVLAGRALQDRVPKVWIERAAGLAFVVVGVLRLLA